MAGRPSDITTIVGQKPDGTPITVADRVVSAVYLHGYVEPAAAAAGVTKVTVYEWLKVAGKALLRLRGEPLKPGQNGTEHEEACIRFSNAIDEASAQWMTSMLNLADKLSEGGLEQIEEHVETDGDGQVVKRRTVRKTTLPDGAMIRWRLTRRDPKHYGDRVELSGPEGAPLLSVDERAVAILENLRARQAEKKPKRKPRKS